MQLTLSTESVCNTVLTTETGQVLYKTFHPPIKVGAVTTLRKVVPNDGPTDMQDQYAIVGEIAWRVFGSSTLRSNGEEHDSERFLPRHGIMGRWDMLLRVVVLSRDNESKAEVVRYHRGSLSIIGPKRQPRLDIDPEVIHMLDLVILTFVYVETLRMDKESCDVVIAKQNRDVVVCVTREMPVLYSMSLSDGMCIT